MKNFINNNRFRKTRYGPTDEMVGRWVVMVTIVKTKTVESYFINNLAKSAILLT